MSGFLKIPVQVIKDFRGRVIQTAQLDDDGEVEYKAIECPSKDCSFDTTSLKTFQTHVLTHEETAIQQAKLNIIPVLVDATTQTMLLQLLNTLNNSQSALASAGRNFDSQHAGAVWKAAWRSLKNNTGVVRIHKDQYRWLHDLLERKVSEKDIKVEEQKTAAMITFGLSWYSTVQAFKIESERDDIEDEEKKVEIEVSLVEIPSIIASK
jgi:hypothetical protein